MSGRSRSNKQRTNNLVALGSAALLAVYSAGFVRTRAAAARFADEGAARRPSDLNVVSTAHAATPSNDKGARAAAPDVGVVDNTMAAPIARQGAPRAIDNVTASATTAKTPIGVVTRATAEKKSADMRATTPITAATTPVATTPAPAMPAPAAALAAPAAPAAPHTDTVVARAVAVAAAVVEPAPPAKEKVGYTDGTYYGWGTSRHGDIQAEVEIKNGRIVSASIAQCLTRYSCSWIAALPAQVLARQSADVDYVSGATQSTNAYYYAVVDALLKAK